ncbi:MAG: type II toxin-antitoxin system RelE/ParE family toxin [Deltaproteobacteria bacterium]|nr:type II toxin-antitoxin system RelE/ParE family toxin [Deltaproteobacteria bacterium]
MHKVLWHPKAREAVRGFPKEVKNEIGYLLFRLQKGDQLGMPHSRPIKAVMSGVGELRVRGTDGIYRAFYYVKTDMGVLVFHAFKKKDQKTPKREIEAGRKNLKESLYG